MSVESRVSICYGVILSEEELIEINQHLTDEECDELSDWEYLTQIDSWCGGDWFLGVENSLGNLSEPLLLADLFNIPADWIEEFGMELKKVPWSKWIKWEPEKYLIQFWY